MGPAGSGKTTVGRLVAGRLDVEFLDADDFHAPTDRDDMRRGVPLDDHRRGPWLDRLRDALAERRRKGVVLACSALRVSYRRRLRRGLPQLRFVALVAPPEVLRRRLDARRGHFAGSALLASQLAALELGDDVVTVDASGPVEQTVELVLEALGQAGRASPP